jgi:hypothetical protein
MKKIFTYIAYLILKLFGVVDFIDQTENEKTWRAAHDV